LLDNAENYGEYFAQALMNTNVNITDPTIAKTMTIERSNIGEFDRDKKIGLSILPESE
jgi:hypothetical protein